MAVRCEADIKSYITKRLGTPVVGVELDPSQLDACIRDAKEWFCGYIGQTKRAELSFVVNTNEYDVPVDCDYVVEVAFVRKLTNVYLGYDFADVEVPPPGYPGFTSAIGVTSGYSDLMQALQYRETARRMLSSDRDWEYDKSVRKLRFYPTNLTNDKVVYWYMTNDLDLDLLEKREQWLIRQYSFACAMETLGFIRSKYSGYPSASGDIQLNGDDLLSRAEALKLDLDEKIRSLRQPVAFFAE